MRSLLVFLLIAQVFTWCPKMIPEDKGKGWLDRYWDCCKEWCSWSENAGKENESVSCDKQGYPTKDYWLKSSCDGGEAYCCPSHAPFTDPKCPDIAYGFATVPKLAEPLCGKCYQLRFLGEGKYETRMAHKLLREKNKVMYVMTIGVPEKEQRDKEREDAFDLLIPGGGTRESKACNEIYKDLGAPYGGLLTDCENEVGYGYPEEELYELRKECLRRRCHEVFPFGSDEFYGCLFQADWLEAASYPLFYWLPVECPEELVRKYKYGE